MNMINNKLIEKEAITKLVTFLRECYGADGVKELETVPLGINYRPDGFLTIHLGKYEIPIAVEVKIDLQHHSQLQRLTEMVNKFEGIFMVVASVID